MYVDYYVLFNHSHFYEIVITINCGIVIFCILRFHHKYKGSDKF